MQSRARLVAQIVDRVSVSPEEVQAMWRLFQRYYEAVSEEEFLADLREKSHVIMLRTAGTTSIQGFSTLVVSEERLRERTVDVVFSGDTIVDSRHWGDRSLQRAFVRFILRRKLTRPLRPIYWLLLTKGYKTYLLLARNFVTYFPRVGRATPELYSSLITRVCRRRYGEAYCAAEGLVRFAQSHGQLKPGVVPLYGSQLEDPDIAYFLQRNPDYARGVELACLGEASVWTMLRFILRKVLLLRRGARGRTKAQSPSVTVRGS